MRSPSVRSRSFQFNFSNEVAAGATETVERTVQYDGHLTELVVGWPTGTSNDVGVQFRRSDGEVLFPRDSDTEYVEANDFIHPFVLESDVSEDEVLVAEFRNNDAAAHFVTVVATVAENPG